CQVILVRQRACATGRGAGITASDSASLSSVSARMTSQPFRLIRLAVAQSPAIANSLQRKDFLAFSAPWHTPCILCRPNWLGLPFWAEGPLADPASLTKTRPSGEIRRNRQAENSPASDTRCQYIRT